MHNDEQLNGGAEDKHGEAEIELDRLRHVSLAYRHREPIRLMPGFKKKNHQVPDQVNAHTQAFVAKLAADRVKQDLDRVFAELRLAFRFKRNEIQSDDCDAGMGSITTPYFRYTCAVSQNPDVADEAIWSRDVSQITDVDQLMTESFIEVFGEVFDTVEFTPNEPIQLEQIIDRVESIENDRMWIEYDRQLSYCEVTLGGCDERIRITREAFRIIHPQAVSPQVLVDSLFRIQNRLLGFSSSPECDED